MDEKNISKDEQIGFHKGALSTLAKERSEMQKILTIVEQLMQMHVQSLGKLGVDLNAQAGEATQEAPAVEESAEPIEDILNKHL